MSFVTQERTIFGCNGQPTRWESCISTYKPLHTRAKYSKGMASVGESSPTGGVSSGPRSMAALPRTNHVWKTDAYWGRRQQKFCFEGARIGKHGPAGSSLPVVGTLARDFAPVKEVRPGRTGRR